MAGIIEDSQLPRGEGAGGGGGGTICNLVNVFLYFSSLYSRRRLLIILQAA